RVAVSTPDKPEKLRVGMITIDGPVWLKPDSIAAELFPTKAGERVKVGFLASAAEIATNSKQIQKQMADAPGRTSRALPLFLAEQTEFFSEARVQTLLPWIAGESPGFVVSGGPWNDEDAANYARQEELKNDYVVTMYLKTVGEPWTAELRLVRTID